MTKYKGVIGMIPARFGSTRLPGKALRNIVNKPMIQRVYERCLLASILDSVYVVTDDQRIADTIESVGGKAILTSSDHLSGTDRLAEAAMSIDADIIVNIQGDQPFIDPLMIEEAVQPLLEDPAIEMSTVMHPISRPEALSDSSVVKVVVDNAGFGLYFSRSLIPFPRQNIPHKVYEHVGLYVYRKPFLLTFAGLPPSIMEQVESLEQLRALENGYRIKVVETNSEDHEFNGFSVDTEEDLQRAETMLRERNMT